ncbi:hypothetical protein MINS_36740 [Mycolicibacterium insubricum]|jgi:hypothetical protein|uniref:Uncharacterized protein n=1 Tax=Mycolicibacterium insubricum TaxID=444597 RepID=A0A1X0DMA8_9MYCO|nr:hypothetical protein [Mycolicibacterium insubricum]MCB9442137.1 hypothetical protein [Mycolicibacterium sp.]MCV7081178.1 hypothetical protein [Mycolicibacterium insubricum]ORA73541.1 hypothetical protein BST26_01790 [Mycolicibacterium insubricum]BBZ68245.1 hypothetical protein MINS_36740 [Mycolicibacterium insubricum]
MGTTRTVLIATLIIGAVPGTVVTAAPATADCTTSGATTICSQGEVRGSPNASPPRTSGPAYPYPCTYDYLCGNGGASIIFTPGRRGGRGPIGGW